MRQTGKAMGDDAVLTETRQDVLDELKDIGYETEEEFTDDTGTTVDELVGVVWMYVGDEDRASVYTFSRSDFTTD